MRGAMIECGKLLLLSLVSGLLIVAVISFVAMPSFIARHAIESTSQEHLPFLHTCLQGGILIAVVAYVVQTISKVISDH